MGVAEQVGVAECSGCGWEYAVGVAGNMQWVWPSRWVWLSAVGVVSRVGVANYSVHSAVFYVGCFTLLQVNGRIIDCAFTVAFNPKYDIIQLQVNFL